VIGNSEGEEESLLAQPSIRGKSGLPEAANPWQEPPISVINHNVLNRIRMATKLSTKQKRCISMQRTGKSTWLTR
jgi:hypothetical protein